PLLKIQIVEADTHARRSEVPECDEGPEELSPTLRVLEVALAWLEAERLLADLLGDGPRVDDRRAEACDERLGGDPDSQQRLEVEAFRDGERAGRVVRGDDHEKL